ncbi:hypothetical protein [Paraburkholderia dipogonis]|uniref:hypothetical protein n=1 Tax=Paraburkholderia dipogonis TaxID=1211383 RepID=UPI0038BBFD85
MKASEALKQVLDAVVEAEKGGAKDLSIENLKVYLGHIAAVVEQDEHQATTAASEEQVNRQFEVWKAQLSADSAMNVELFKATTEAGQTAVRSAIVINGGAAATMLAFAGNAITKGQIVPGAPLLTAIGTALLWFMLGVGAAGVASGFRYLSQFAYSEWRRHPAGRRFGTATNVISICLGVGSFAMFFVGGIAAYHAVVVPMSP